MKLTGVAQTDIKLFEFIVRMSLLGAKNFESRTDFVRGELAFRNSGQNAAKSVIYSVCTRVGVAWRKSLSSFA